MTMINWAMRDVERWREGRGERCTTVFRGRRCTRIANHDASMNATPHEFSEEAVAPPRVPQTYRALGNFQRGDELPPEIS